MKPSSLLSVLTVLFSFLSAMMSPLSAADAIGLSGQDYGATEIKAISRMLMAHELPGLTVEDAGTKLDPDRLGEFRIVVLAGSDRERANAYTPEESRKVEAWVREGGRLVLIHQAPKRLRVAEGEREESFLYGRSYYIREPQACSIVLPDDAVLKEVFAFNPDPEWLKGNIRIDGKGWTNVIGDDEGRVLVGWREDGKGKVYFLGNELFRIQSKKDSGEIVPWETVLRNILTEESTETGQP